MIEQRPRLTIHFGYLDRLWIYTNGNPVTGGF